jgi:hypothetical protein
VARPLSTAEEGAAGGLASGLAPMRCYYEVVHLILGRTSITFQ